MSVIKKKLYIDWYMKMTSGGKTLSQYNQTFTCLQHKVDPLSL